MTASLVRARTLVPVSLVALLVAAVALVSSPATARAGLKTFTIHGIADGTTGGEVAVYFNPKEYTVTKATPWKHHDIQGLDAPTLEFTSGEPYRCQFELFFDRYEEGKSVREITDKIEKLALVDPQTRQRPRVLVSWNNALWTNQLLAVETEILDSAAEGTPLAAVVRTLWSAFVPADDPAPTDPPALVPVTVEGGGVRLPAALLSHPIDLLTLRPDHIVKSQPIRPHDVQGLSPAVDFSFGDPQRLRLSLEFDTSDEKVDVRRLTEALAALARVDPKTQRPPTVLLQWGTGLAFKCILESFSLRFTLFLDDGTPVRAVMNTVWTEFSPAEEQLRGNPRH
jgi:hypothetical protein